MSCQPNTAFYRGGDKSATDGIQISKMRNNIKQVVEPTIIVGLRRLQEPVENCDVFTPCDGATVLWPLCGQALDTSKNSSLLNASITSRITPNGEQHFLTRYAHDGKCLVLIQTGIKGPKDIGSRVRPLFHGAIPLAGNPRELAAWRSQANLLNTDIPNVKRSLYYLSPGDELLVGDVYPSDFHEARIVVSNGSVQVVDVPEWAHRRVEQHGREFLSQVA
jgi:hypothetical protein